ncbi:PH domain-containing protein [Novispirillum itersonii]|uniref:PH domain-containing protein n=1 Tax=Novispirillum itersonii TaxID=189 RepID=UPI000370466F|nr:PH domain-containing protein [Novispirillum itersonii]
MPDSKECGVASYVRESLLDGEKILYEGAVSLWAILPKLMAGLLLLPLFGYGLVLWMSASAYYSSTELCVTNRRVVARLGMVRRRIVEFHIAKVESVRIEQGLFGRMFGFGTVTVLGASENGESIKGIDNPVAFRRALLQVQEIVLRRTGAAYSAARARMAEEDDARPQMAQQPAQPARKPQPQPQPQPKQKHRPPANPVQEVERMQQALGRHTDQDDGWPEDPPHRARPVPFAPPPPRKGPLPGEWD